MKVLLIEDEKAQQELFIQQFKILGHEVIATESVEDALDLYPSYAPDMILSDIELDGLIRGYEIIDILAKKYMETPNVILMSGGTTINKEQALLYGAKNFFNKPFKFQEICIEMQNIILLNNLVESTIDDLFALSNCCSIGVRLTKGINYPYYKSKGFSDSFILQEKFLCGVDPDGNHILECMCGNILEGRFDPSKSFFTSRGSFWENCTSDLLVSATDNDLIANTRNICNKSGYESVALVAIKDEKRTYGLLQLNDFKENMFTESMIKEVETLSGNVAKSLEYLI